MDKTICTACIWCINTVIELAEADLDFTSVGFILDQGFISTVTNLPGVHMQSLLLISSMMMIFSFMISSFPLSLTPYVLVIPPWMDLLV